jgi:hypothetical protein
MTATYGLLNQVEDAMASGSAARRGKIVRHVTDLFIVGSAQCTEQDIALFDDVLTRLAAEIETSARALLAVRLAPVENAPPRIIHALAFDDEIDVAGPVLEQSVRLDERALLENARQKGQARRRPCAGARELRAAQGGARARDRPLSPDAGSGRKQGPKLIAGSFSKKCGARPGRLSGHAPLCRPKSLADCSQAGSTSSKPALSGYRYQWSRSYRHAR